METSIINNVQPCGQEHISYSKWHSYPPEPQHSHYIYRKFEAALLEINLKFVL